jgi:hypothetical protein
MTHHGQHEHDNEHDNEHEHQHQPEPEHKHEFEHESEHSHSDRNIHEIEKTLGHIEHTLRYQTNILLNILYTLNPNHPPPITGFTIAQIQQKQGDSVMALTPIAPGFSPAFTAAPVPSTSFPAPGNLPVMTSSDPVNAPVTTDVTGLIGTVAIPTTAVVGTVFTLTESYTNADATVATGTASYTIVAAPSPDITSFNIAQSA